MNKKGQMGSELMITVLIIGLLFGGLGGAKLSNLNPFKSSNPSSIQKSNEYKKEYYKDEVKGIEYRVEEKIRNQNTENKDQRKTIGQSIGHFIDSSLKFLVWFGIIGILLLIFTGINIFKKVKRLFFKANKYRKAFVQTVNGVERAKTKINGEHVKLEDELSKTHDDETKDLVRKVKRGENDE